MVHKSRVCTPISVRAFSDLFQEVVKLPPADLPSPVDQFAKQTLEDPAEFRGIRLEFGEFQPGRETVGPTERIIDLVAVLGELPVSSFGSCRITGFLPAACDPGKSKGRHRTGNRKFIALSIQSGNRARTILPQLEGFGLGNHFGEFCFRTVGGLLCYGWLGKGDRIFQYREAEIALLHCKTLPGNRMPFTHSVEENPDPPCILDRRETVAEELEISETLAEEARFGQLIDIFFKRGDELLARKARICGGQAVDGHALALDRLQSKVEEEQGRPCYGEQVYGQGPQVRMAKQALHGRSLRLVTSSLSHPPPESASDKVKQNHQMSGMVTFINCF